MLDSCEICGDANWTDVYRGDIRAGAFETFAQDGTVAACGGCGVWRLDELHTFGAIEYESTAYRSAMDQGLDTDSFFANHDPTQIMNLVGVGVEGLRGAVIADIGCGAGSFLDFVSGVAAGIVAVEPGQLYQESMRQRGFSVYSYAEDALVDYAGKVDLAVSFQVIEHVPDPKAFLVDMRRLLRPGGRAVVATPNRRDILLTLLPDEFSSFYYRSAHRWYFDEESLAGCAERAGLKVDVTRYLHSYGLSNAVAWLRDRKPIGLERIKGIDALGDRLWSSYLETTAQTDTIYASLSVA